jgi:hypothetical protein
MKEGVIKTLTQEVSGLKDKEATLYSNFVAKCQQCSQLETQLQNKNKQTDDFVKDLHKSFDQVKAQ